MSDDLIKRSDAIEALRKLGHEVVVIDKVCSLGVAAEFIDAIRAIPSADLNAEFVEWAKLWFKKELEADRPQGEWIAVDSYSAFGGSEEQWNAHGNPIAYHYCSNCKSQTRVDEFGEEMLTDFCSNCGARMKGVDNE